MANDTCDCGRFIEQPKTGRRRSKCRVCSPPDTRPASRKAGPLSPAAPSVREIRPGVSDGPAGLTESTERRLRDLGLLDDPTALVVLHLAQAIDAGGHSGSSLASLSREFRAALDGVVAKAAPAAADDDGVSWDVG